MAISPEDKQTLNSIVPTEYPRQEGELETKKRTRSDKKNNDLAKEHVSGDISDSSVSYSSSSSSVSSADQAAPSGRRRRRRRQRGRGGATKRVSAAKPEPEISEEEQSKYLAMDCEMVGVGEGGHRSVLARVTIVDWQGVAVLDQYVKCPEKITDYRTFVSGITEAHLEGADDISACRTNVAEVLDGKILVGHHLKNDLKAVGVSHPWFMTRDTAKWEPFMKLRFDDGVLWPRKLKELCQEKLKREIQIMGQPHSPVEDAVAALDLYKSVRNKWEKVMAYNVNKTKEIMNHQIAEQKHAK